MKLITKTTVTFKKGDKTVTVPPGENDFPKEVGENLIERGHAEIAGNAKKASGGDAPKRINAALKDALDEAGVEYDAKATKAELTALLEAAKEAAEGGGDDAGAGDDAGTGDDTGTGDDEQGDPE